MINQIATVDYYDSLALQKARDSLETAQRDLARAVLDRGGNPSDIAAWEKEAGGRIATTVEQVEKILADRKPSTAKATVAASLLADLARGYSLDSG